ncbi:PH, RCC1 and FYVE domains-containing protein 1-like [Nicotiana tabacum]|uniref:PH, RCC1 and FYVE domains-containing protein 1-like n=1 Tax=Nicotiana tabacum TaxID=4097 RepID=A0AC58SM05_TOBAC
MADPANYGNPDRDIDQGLIALKKGTQLIKYSRKGKPKFCPFRVSPDETTLIWYSRGAERNLKLSSVSKIIPGQRTPVFKRYLRPEKEYLSFSLIYNNGERSLDLICKDKIEAEIWIAGLKNLISAGQARNSRRTQSDISDLQNTHPCGSTLDFSQTIARDWTSADHYSGETSLSVRSSDVGSERGNMQVRTSSDGFRISVSSTPSCSSGGSGPDDIESLGDVYVWGEIWCDGVSKDGAGNPITIKHDVLSPKPLESNVVLDVHQIACGVRHIALVTRQGEVFTWGEESGGRLGHGIEKDFSRPRLVEFLAVTNVDFVSCGEYHTCAVSTLGDLYTWGDGTHNAGLLGHGNDVSHWIPKRVSGPLEGLQVLSVACGTWHSALATANGKLFTFGDGSFGVLGHGDRESVLYPKEVQSLNGLKTIKVACGVWHTAAIVEVTNHNCGNVPTRKLFTWGDGDKNRLGHGNKETYLLPTCVSAIIDYNFHQLACGHNITVGLTTSGHVFIMGSNAYGQLGNPQADGKVPSLVQDKLVGEFVEEIVCGAFHVAVLTSRSEVFTWGKGANGRLGHGDTEDRNAPTLVEALKDRHVKNIACGSNYTASICIHKWVSGADQSVCSGCRQAFGFTRKRHNCYNCGLVHCHACSSKKALKAALAPTPGKPHRVCESCYMKLKKASEGSSSFYDKKFNSSHRPENSKLDRGEPKTSRVLLSPTVEPIKYLEVKSTRPGIKSDSLSIVRASQVPSLLQLKDIAFPSSLSALQHALKPVVTAQPQPQSHSQSQSQSQPPSSNSRPASPYSRRPSPPRSPAPVFSRGVIDSLRKTNDVLHQEVAKLQNQIKSLKQKSDGQDAEIKKLKESSQESSRLVAERASKCNIAVETMKSITAQLKEMTQELPPDISESSALKSIQTQVESFLNTFGNQASEDNTSLSSDMSYNQQKPTHRNNLSSESVIRNDQWDAAGVQETSHNVDGTIRENHGQSASETRGVHQSSAESVSGSPKAQREGQKEVIEQFEPGVYVTLLQLTNGTKIFKRVRFSKRRFAEQQAEEWWKENKDRLLKKYSPPKTNVASADSSFPPPPATEENSETSQAT